MSTTAKAARVEQTSASKLPFLTAGQITPEALRAWEMGCTQFFLHKEVKDNEKVKKIAWGMQDPIVQDWYLNNQAKFDALTFKEYIAEVRTYWLPTDWADAVHRKMLASVQGQRPFAEWAVDVQSQNTLLHDTTSHLDDKNILYHLKSHMNTDLAADYYAENVTETELHKWIEKKEAVDAALRAERTRSRPEKKNMMSARPNTKVNNGSSTTSNKTFVRLPPLSDVERQLLCDNDSCFKCREPFAGHTSGACQKGFPDGMMYKALTTASIAAKKLKSNGNVVAAVDVNNKEKNTVAVVMLSAVLGDGTDSGEECMAPLQTPHLRWTCLLDGPAVTSPISVSALIDHGSS
ncbi:hypothetical protein EV702DRAFT_1192955 [Suillus placidus]|uniref:Uncharacterized protein n=1 Tax=Suillus placidus TaxID=48579 RepID=A0A9P7A2W7_9AGAM|nr:hypothetical protein EV702DRAFT_1192955 [Suillus placidus]